MLNFLGKCNIVILLTIALLCMVVWILLRVGKRMCRGGGDMCQLLVVGKACIGGGLFGRLYGGRVCVAHVLITLHLQDLYDLCMRALGCQA